jgi:hypothetical protein
LLRFVPARIENAVQVTNDGTVAILIGAWRRRDEMAPFFELVQATKGSKVTRRNYDGFFWLGAVVGMAIAAALVVPLALLAF